MRIILKILAAPFVLVLTILWAVLVFIFGWVKTVLHYISVDCWTVCAYPTYRRTDHRRNCDLHMASC